MHFRSKVLVDFLHYVTQINCLTGAIIARQILRRLYLNKLLYDPPQNFNLKAMVVAWIITCTGKVLTLKTKALDAKKLLFKIRPLDVE